MAPLNACDGFTFTYLGYDGADLTESDYRETWQLQRDVHARVVAGEIGPQVLFVQHTPVYTAGKRTEPHERPQDGTPVVDVDRGGKITYHGPGQLVGYPIVTLTRKYGPLEYVRRLEQAVIDTLAGEFGVPGIRVEGRTGVWLPADGVRPERKICAIGVRVAKMTTMHGFALNVAATSTGLFGSIIPCGIADAGVTSIEDETGAAPPRLVDVARAIEPQLERQLSFALTSGPERALV
ncbi:lipoyl(octanoyl) transferase LipB [Propioniciclava coleopterorum]|uniref:lipoyl(octanoyl) transferase LipB n=1 Tax=Propioniciclava coleopterorum TaxID=2714937 RepID=UPI001FEAEFB2|nr:lipoyl(octanoyl) transferase LipB [Propioniciclava coleopterorum]